MDMERRLNASGMAHLLASFSGRLKDDESRDRIRRALEDYCRVNNCDLVRCASGGFAVEPRLP